MLHRKGLVIKELKRFYNVTTANSEAAYQNLSPDYGPMERYYTFRWRQHWKASGADKPIVSSFQSLPRSLRRLRISQEKQTQFISAPRASVGVKSKAALMYLTARIIAVSNPLRLPRAPVRSDAWRLPRWQADCHKAKRRQIKLGDKFKYLLEIFFFFSPWRCTMSVTFLFTMQRNA